MFDHNVEHICSYNATLRQPLEVIGETPVGLRVNAYISGGDSLTIRPDGVGVLDVRATIETSDGALVYEEYMGLMDLGPDGYQRMLTGNPPARAAIQVAPRFLTSHPDYLWLNRLQCLNVGMADFATSSVSYDTYAVRSRVLE